MGELNEDTPARRPGTGQQRTGERAESGGGPLSVAELLARVRPGAQPADAADRAGQEDPVQPPAVGGTGETERLAGAITAEAARLLPGAEMAPDTDFFDAGGTSVDAVALVAKLSRDLGLELSLDDVFADARPRRLAERALRTNGIRPQTEPMRPERAGAQSAERDAQPVRIPADRAEPPTFDEASLPVPPERAAPPPSPERAALPVPVEPANLPVPVPASPVPVPVSASVPLAVQARNTTLPAPASAPTGADEDLELILADLARADGLPWVRRPEPAVPRTVLLTGATGFLGGHMLLDLLRHSEAHVHCLVRAADEEEGTRRLGEALKRFALPWSGEIRRRVTVVPGDIRQPHLGLPDERWEALAEGLDAVVSVAAAVDFLRGYRSLRASNVLGPLTLAELAAAGRPKPLHHISSIAVFNEVGIESMGEDDPVAHIDALVAGYDKSKWAAEAVLRRAREHGLAVTLLRPGGIGGHTRTGASNPQDLSSGMMSVFSRFRTVPAFRFLNAAPVDWVSRVAVAAICEPEAWGRTYHLSGTPNSLADVVHDMRFGGMNVRVQGWEEWRSDVVARLRADPVPELEFLARVLASPTAAKLCEASLTAPAATAERTDAFVAEQNLPASTRYGMQEQLRTFEKLARDGLARLPARTDQPYLWFPETMEGALGPVGGAARTPCSAAFTLSIAGMYQLAEERRVDVRGEISCPLLHPDPLVVEHGDLWVRPEDGIPLDHGLRHPLLRYRLRLCDGDGGRWWLEGRKFARARRDLWRQTRALTVEIGREGEPATLHGEIVVPTDSYLRDQIDGIRVDPRLSGQEKRLAKMSWLTWFGLEIGRGMAGPFARVGADLLDLRRTPTPPPSPTPRERKR
ncbi:polyketide synthase [Streptomyces sp. WZ.A104]|uniref:thioester reductase domain-containing protein n=1 Tax=Streptomyces sp. WZ.A104 TaxID=2023771 RepID=UPI000BBC2E19|nr:thioester reductase domain-containing protein [Streptomyces sp. WZ.A104]PCG86725.1 polyketide synthase [Streptomyces sp. WZ.A104]